MVLGRADRAVQEIRGNQGRALYPVNLQYILLFLISYKDRASGIPGAFLYLLNKL